MNIFIALESENIIICDHQTPEIFYDHYVFLLTLKGYSFMSQKCRPVRTNVTPSHLILPLVFIYSYFHDTPTQ